MEAAFLLIYFELLFGLESPTLSATLENKTAIINDDIFLNSLAHIIDGCRSSLSCHQGFHFDTSLVSSSYFSFKLNGGFIVNDGEPDIDITDRERVTHGDAVSSPFGGLDTGDLGSGQHVTFWKRVLLEQVKCLRRKANRATNYRRPLAVLLIRHIDHTGIAVTIHMRETTSHLFTHNLVFGLLEEALGFGCQLACFNLGEFLEEFFLATIQSRRGFNLDFHQQVAFVSATEMR